MKFSFWLIIPILLLLLVATPTLAISPTLPPPSPTPTSSTSDEIQKIRQAVQEKVQEKLNQIVNKPVKRGWLGTITQTNAAQITLTSHNQSRIVIPATDLTIVSGSRKLDIVNLKIGQTILALGYLKPDNTLDTKRIVVVDAKSIIDIGQIVSGRIVDSSTSSAIFVLVPFDNKDLQYQVKTDTKSVILSKTSQKISALTLISGQKIIAFLNPLAKGSKTYLIQQAINLTYTPSPTPTPTTKPTKQPTPTIKITP